MSKNNLACSYCELKQTTEGRRLFEQSLVEADEDQELKGLILSNMKVYISNEY